MNLVFYSGGLGRESKALSLEVVSLLARKKSARIVYIPADSEYADEDFEEFQRDFAATGVTRFRFECISVDRPLSKEEEKRLFSADAIFLGGGNTFYFLHHLRARKMLSKLKAFAKRGGLLMGLSAGSILMTPSIMTASVPSCDSDDNEIGLRDLKAMNLVPFEFSPHYTPSASADRELRNYSKKLDYPIYACKDGQGIIVRNGTIQFVGKVSVFHNGVKYQIQ